MMILGGIPAITMLWILVMHFVMRTNLMVTSRVSNKIISHVYVIFVTRIKIIGFSSL